MRKIDKSESTRIPGLYVQLLLPVLLLSGCMTITASKSLVVTPKPTDTTIVVTGNAVSRCQHYVLFFRCTLNIEMQQAK